MISFIKGTVDSIEENGLIIDNNGIGFYVSSPVSTLSRLYADDAEIKLYTYMSVREDDISLFGFLTKSELEMFKLLITVSGIGPKGAIGILSSLSVDELRMAIAAEDSKLISRAKGVGAKTAQRIVVELKNKVDEDFSGISRIPGGAQAPGGISEGAVKEAIDVLEALGFSRTESVRAISSLEGTDSMDAPEIASAALKVINM